MRFDFTFLLALTIAFLIAAVIAIIWMLKGTPNAFTATMVCSTLLFCFFICAVFTYKAYLNDTAENEKQATIEKVEQYVAEGWEVYIDGQQVDIDNIILEEYIIQFNEDAEKILLKGE